VVPDGRGIRDSYAAATHDLSRLARFPAPLLELGRVCVRPGAPEAAMRAAWGLLTRIADQAGVRLLFGCASFEGADPAPHLPALALLGRDHLAPPAWAPGRGAPETVDLTALDPLRDRPAALRAMPPLLRSYLAMGGWVGRHAAIDRALDTVQVLTAVETARVPPARARALRALAATRPPG
jgi:putative hemolysin